MPRYRVTFDRIGRKYDPEPLVTDAASMNELAERVYDHARPHLLSSGIEVTASERDRRGYIHAGMHTAGTFTFEEVET